MRWGSEGVVWWCGQSCYLVGCDCKQVAEVILEIRITVIVIE